MQSVKGKYQNAGGINKTTGGKSKKAEDKGQKRKSVEHRAKRKIEGLRDKGKR